MAFEEFLNLNNTSENKIINRSYKDCVFTITFNDADILADLQDVGLDTSTMKFELKIIIGGYEAAILKSPTGYFHIEQVLQDYTKTDSQGYAKLFGSHLMPQSASNGILYNDRPHAIHKIDKFACNRDNLIQVNFQIGLSFYNTDTQTFFPAKFTPPKNKHVLSRYYFWNAVQPHNTMNATTDGIRDVTEFYPYILDMTNKKFLTNQLPEYDRKVRVSDYQTLAFFNGKFCDSANQNHGHQQGACANSLVKYIYCEIYDANNNLTTVARVENNEDNGGSYAPTLNSIALQPPNWMPWNRGLLYVGVGPANIINSWEDVTNGGIISSSDFSSASRYEIFATGSGGIAQRKSVKYHFEITQDQDCKGYETIRLAYLNNQGAWDYINFTKKSTRSVEITRSNYKQNYGVTPLRYGGSTNPSYNQWDYDPAMGGTKTYNVNAIETIEANSDWLTEQDAIYLEELFVSPDVYMQERNREFVPVIVTEKDYTKQTKANDKLIQYVISIQKGHEHRIQRL